MTLKTPVPTLKHASIAAGKEVTHFLAVLSAPEEV
jgi:hypothetical protein